MPSSSRSKSHKQSKHTSREYSDLEKQDLKKNANEFFTPTKKRWRDKICIGSDEGEVVDIDDTDLKSKRSEKKSDKESGRIKVYDGKYETMVLPKEVENESSKRGREHKGELNFRLI